MITRVQGFEDLSSMELLYEGKVTTLYVAVPKQCQDIKVVVKVCHTSGLSAHMHKQILQERDLLCTLKHPHVIQGLCSFEDAGTICIVQEYADGGSMAAWHSHLRCTLTSCEIAPVILLSFRDNLIL